MNTKLVLPVVLGITIGIMSIMVLLTPQQQSLAYNKFGFDNQTQCVNVTNLEFQGGLFDHKQEKDILEAFCSYVQDNDPDLLFFVGDHYANTILNYLFASR